MTPRKECFIAIKEQLANVAGLERVDLYRGQFENGSNNYPTEFTTVLIGINSVEWETMTNKMQEGQATIDVILYCKDGWMDQHLGTADPDHGLTELDLIDGIVDALQFLKGNTFTQLEQNSEETEEQDYDRLMSYRMGFSSTFYKRTPYAFAKARLTTISSI